MLSMTGSTGSQAVGHFISCSSGTTGKSAILIASAKDMDWSRIDMVQVHRSCDLGVRFAAPRLDLDRVVQPRIEVPPLLNVPLAEIIDFLVETGGRIRDPNNVFMQKCIERMCATHVPPQLRARLCAAADPRIAGQFAGGGGQVGGAGRDGQGDQLV